MPARPSAPSPATLLASVAIFLSLTGGAVAAGVKIGKNSVGSVEIRNGSVKGGDLADDTVTGTQVIESTLGVVPRAASAGSAAAATNAATAGTARYADRAATAALADRASSTATADRATSAGSADRATSAERAQNADRANTASTATSADRAATAGDADRLAGRGASSFTSASDVFPVGVKLAAGQTATLVERDGVRLQARCQVEASADTTGTATVLSLFASSTVDGATLESPESDRNGSAGRTLGPATTETDRLAYRGSVATGAQQMRVSAGGIIVTSVNGTSIFFGATSGFRLGFGLHGALCSVQAPVVVSVF